jgi:hypothetical protein
MLQHGALENNDFIRKGLLHTQHNFESDNRYLCLAFYRTDGSLYRIPIPEPYTGPLYRTLIPDPYTGPLYRIPIPELYTGPLYRILIPDPYTGPLYSNKKKRQAKVSIIRFKVMLSV